jgi:hypothetical protein
MICRKLFVSIETDLIELIMVNLFTDTVLNLFFNQFASILIEWFTD